MENFEKHLYIVILCGGTGTRVWPLSIDKNPKQFLNFYEDKTLFQGALLRALKIVSPDRVIAITNEKYVDEIKKEAPQILPENILAEPQKKNTAMAMGVASAYIAKKDPDAVVINLYSDHVVKNTDLFAQTMKAAAKVSYEKNKIITVGIVPAYPHPGFGYIKFDNKVSEENQFPVYKVDSFKEKPDIKTAEIYQKAGNYLWNTGFYIWRVELLFQELQKFSPEILCQVNKACKGLASQNLNLIKEAYSTVEEAPIDTTIAEKTDKLLVIPGKFDWNDVGSWQVVYELGKKDENGNVLVKSNKSKTKAPTILQDTQNSLVYSNDLPIAVLGLKDIVVVDTGKGILVCDRKKSNDVKKIVEQLKDKKLEKYL